MADRHDNRVTVTLGGTEYVLCASKRAERTYGNRFRSDIDALGVSETYIERRGEDGKPTGARVHMGYTGRLREDVAISAAASINAFGDGVPLQVVAAAWAMARAAGSTDLGWEGWLDMWDELPSNSVEDIELWQAVCVDLSERAFFRDLARPSDAREPDEGEAV